MVARQVNFLFLVTKIQIYLHHMLAQNARSKKRLNSNSTGVSHDASLLLRKCDPRKTVLPKMLGESLPFQKVRTTCDEDDEISFLRANCS